MADNKENDAQTVVNIKNENLLKQEKQRPIWPGLNRFCCNNWIIYGPSSDNGPLICGWGSLIAASAIFWACVCPFLWIHVSPALPIIGSFFLVLDFYVYYRAAFVDPGIIPRLELQNELNLLQNGNIDERSQKINQEKTLGDIYYNNEPLTQGNGTLPECSTCKILRPHLSSHCRYCDNCIEGFDHHCNWIGNCVGQRNHRYFVGFVVTTTVCCAWLCGSGITYLITLSLKFGGITGSAQDIFTFILVFGLGILFFFMFNVSMWHIELVMCGQTLKMRDRNGVKHTPWRKAFMNLFRFFLYYKPRTSHFDPRHVRYMPAPCEC